MAMTFRHAAVLESNTRTRRVLAQALRRAGLRVTEAATPSELTKEEVVLLGPTVTGRARLIREVRALRPSALLLVAGRAGGRAASTDGYVPLPLSAQDLKARLPELEALRERRGNEDRRPELRPGEGILDPRTGFYTFTHFREVVFIEVKRARRYGFPLSIALAAFDPLPPPRLGEAIKAQLHGALALAIRRSLRDTDYPVQYGPERALLLMPHTDLAGALAVARRVCERVAKSTLTEEKRVLRPTVSLGVAGTEAGGREVSFSDLAKQASQSLESARGAGGNRVEFYDLAAEQGARQVGEGE
jgi:diguanylate cyclase (GGDEF)-like protein